VSSRRGIASSAWSARVDSGTRRRLRVVFPDAFALPNANRLRERMDLLRLRLRVAAG